MREEYLAIVDAGFVLQIDDPFLIDMLATDDGAGRARAHGVDARRGAEPCAAGHPHGADPPPPCYGLNHGPRMNDIPSSRSCTCWRSTRRRHSFEVANPRHYHEWRIWEDVKLPEGKILIPA